MNSNFGFRSITLQTKLLFLILGVAISLVVSLVLVGINAIQQTSSTAELVSERAFQSQAQIYMEKVTAENAARHALSLNNAMKEAALLAAEASEYFAEPARYTTLGATQGPLELRRLEENQHVNGQNERASLLVPNFVELNKQIIEEIQISRMLDPLAHAIINNTERVAAVFLSTQNELVRYYPKGNLNLPADFRPSERDFFIDALPVNNPERNNVWTEVYEDSAGLGLMVSAIAPIYVGEQFFGIIGLDFLLVGFGKEIKTSSLTEDSYSFLIDSNGRTVSFPNQAFLDILGRSTLAGEASIDLSDHTGEFGEVIKAMRRGERGFQRITSPNGDRYVAFAPLGAIGWSLATVAASDAMLADINTLGATIHKEVTDLAFAKLLPTVITILLLITLVAFFLSYRMTAPLRQLTEVAAAIGRREWEVDIPKHGSGEVGVLSRSLNAMASQLKLMVTELEERVEGRTAELAASERQFRTAMQYSNAGIALVGVDGEWMEVNDALLDMLGYNREELLDKNFFDIIDAYDLKEVWQGMRGLLNSSHDEWSAEKKYQHRNGRLLTLQANMAVVTDSNDEATHLIIYMVDVTARKRKDEATKVVSTELIKLRGPAFYETAATRLCELLDVEFAWIAHLLPSSESDFETLAMFENGEILSNVSFSGIARPYTDMLEENGSLLIKDQVRDRYPNNKTMKLLRAQAYAAEQLVGPSGQVIGYMGVMKRKAFDTTEIEIIPSILKAFALAVSAEVEQERHERQYQNLVEFAPNAIVVADLGGTIQLANVAAGQMFGYEPKELTNQSVEMLIPSSQRTKHVALREHFAEAPTQRLMGSRDDVIFAQRADGSRFPIEIALSPVDSGGSTMIYAAILDLTERLAAEQDMRQALAALEATEDAAFIIDAETMQHVYVNSGATQQLGYSRDELMQLAPKDVIANFPQEDMDESFARLLSRDERSLHLNVEHTRRDGVLVPVELTIQHVEVPGGRSCFVSLARDVSSRLEQVADREARKAAEQANAAKSAFLATMSHEIRTPMNGVLATAELLARSSLRGEQADLVDTITESAGTLLRVIDDILDFSKIEAGRLDLDYQPVSAQNEVEQACLGLCSFAREKKVSLSLFTDPNLPPWIMSDPVRLKQILNNLISNAVKFSAENSSGGRVHVSASCEKEHIVFKVRDNGIGMSIEDQGKLFQPFVQAESSTTRRFGGTGLGLSIVRRLIDMFDGDISLQSTPGEGSEFTIALPFDVPKDAPPPQSYQSLEDLRCILVDTQEPERVLERQVYIEQAGAESIICANLTAVEQAISQCSGTTEDADVKCPYVVIIEGDRQEVLQWHASLPTHIVSSVVIIENGQREFAREIADNTAVVDADALTRRRLLDAIATASGKASRIITDDDFESHPETYFPPDRTRADQQGALILVAEDNEINQKVIRRQLSLLGFAVDITGDGQEAFDAWRKGNYALLLTDLHMPEVDGYQLTQLIRSAEQEDEHLSIIALTANALKDEASKCLELGMDDYLSKPVALDLLKQKLDQWLVLDSNGNETSENLTPAASTVD